MRVLLADDQAKVRSALRLLLEHQPGVSILGEAVDTTGLLDWVKAACPDLVLLDWELPGLEADGLLLTLRELRPRLKVIALSGRPEAHRAALDAGADAFVSKGDPPERLLKTLRAVGTRRSGYDCSQSPARMKALPFRTRMRRICGSEAFIGAGMTAHSHPRE